MTKSLLVTFHASQNHGSALQAFATQKLLNDFGYDNTILNFQMAAQKKYYSLYGGKGKMKLRQLAMIPLHKQRKSRQKNFLSFQKNYFKMTEEYNTYEDLKKANLSKYDLFVSGSDQIWSDKIPEFVNSDKDYKDIYFGSFIKNIKKIAFATSTGEADVNYLRTQLKYLKQYKHIAVREQSGKKLLSQLLNLNCQVVLDPTLLISRRRYNNFFKLDQPIVDGKYIFLYCLQGVKAGKMWKKTLQQLYAKTQMKIIVVSPFFPIYGKNIINLNDAGPIDFLNLIYNADLVLTDSFHGTAYSINFRKNFFVYQSNKNRDPRKKNLLNKFKLSDRMITSKNSQQIISSYNVDYSAINKIIETKVNESRNVLKSFLED